MNKNNNIEINNSQEEKNNYTHSNKSKKKKVLIIVFIIVILLVIGKIGLIILEKYQIENNKFDEFPACTDGSFSKPIIYLYPKYNEEITVKLGCPEKITCSYPKYEEEWKVEANPDGTLKDKKTGKVLYSLYWEGQGITKNNMQEGFIVQGEKSSEFLEEKLSILGLTEREAEEFIIYWLPKLETNKYNYIRFATIDEINENMPLEINPNPDTIIRVLMTFKGLENPIDIQEQRLETPERTGFVAVEWGGTEIK